MPVRRSRRAGLVEADLRRRATGSLFNAAFDLAHAGYVAYQAMPRPSVFIPNKKQKTMPEEMDTNASSAMIETAKGNKLLTLHFRDKGIRYINIRDMRVDNSRYLPKVHPFMMPDYCHVRTGFHRVGDPSTNELAWMDGGDGKDAKGNFKYAMQIAKKKEGTVNEVPMFVVPLDNIPDYDNSQPKENRLTSTAMYKFIYADSDRRVAQDFIFAKLTAAEVFKESYYSFKRNHALRAEEPKGDIKIPYPTTEELNPNTGSKKTLTWYQTVAASKPGWLSDCVVKLREDFRFDVEQQKNETIKIHVFKISFNEEADDLNDPAKRNYYKTDKELLESESFSLWVAAQMQRGRSRTLTGHSDILPNPFKSFHRRNMVKVWSHKRFSVSELLQRTTVQGSGTAEGEDPLLGNVHYSHSRTPRNIRSYEKPFSSAVTGGENVMPTDILDMMFLRYRAGGSAPDHGVHRSSTQERDNKIRSEVPSETHKRRFMVVMIEDSAGFYPASTSSETHREYKMNVSKLTDYLFREDIHYKPYDQTILDPIWGENPVHQHGGVTSAPPNASDV